MNVPLGISVTFSGIAIFFRFLQLRKMHHPLKSSKLVGKTTVSKLPHSLHAYCPILVMPSGIETLVTALPLNADSPIVVTEYSVPLLVTVSGTEIEPE